MNNIRKNKKIREKKIARLILIILIIINCIVIFNFSSEKSGKSDETSGRVVNAIIEINPRTRKMNYKEKEIEKEKIVFSVRKMAHFTIYTSLGFLLYTLALTYNSSKKKKILFAISIAFLYACTDEIHQLFVPGRSGQFIDVCIDTCGSAFGIIIMSLIMKAMLKNRNLQTQNNK